MARIKLGPVCLDDLDLEATLKRIEYFIASRAPSQIVTLNALMFNLAIRNKEFADVVSGAALVIPDSAGMVWAARTLDGSPVELKTGIDIVERLCAAGAEKGFSIFLLGSAPGVARAAADNLAARYIGLKVAGVHDGYFRENEEELLGQIAKASPDLLFVGLDMPRQELWISRNLKILNVPAVMGVGGSFDVLSGRLKRAPGFMRRLHLEWLFRLFQQPWRIKRMSGLPVFVINIIKLKLTNKTA